MEYILIAVVSVWFVEIVKVPKKFSEWLADSGLWYKEYHGGRLPRRIKPFDCTICLSFWVALIVGIYTECHWISAPYAACASTLAFCFSLFIKRYLR